MYILLNKRIPVKTSTGGSSARAKRKACSKYNKNVPNVTNYKYY